MDSELGHAPVYGEFVSGRVGRVERKEEDGLGDLVLLEALAEEPSAETFPRLLEALAEEPGEE